MGGSDGRVCATGEDSHAPGPSLSQNVFPAFLEGKTSDQELRHQCVHTAGVVPVLLLEVVRGGHQQPLVSQTRRLRHRAPRAVMRGWVQGQACLT